MSAVQLCRDSEIEGPLPLSPMIVVPVDEFGADDPNVPGAANARAVTAISNFLGDFDEQQRLTYRP